jgi:hypothetical protein
VRDATQALTVLAEIDPDLRARLEHRLAAIADDLDGNPVFRPRELPDTHFMRFAIIDDARREFPALLAWETNHDGGAAAYLAAVARAAPAISAVFACCAGYPPTGTDDVDAWVAWMQARSHRAAAFYTGYRGIPRSAVANARGVHDAIRDALDRGDRGELAALSASDLQHRLRDQIAARDGNLDLSHDGPEGSEAREELRWALGKLATVAAVLVVFPLLVVIAPIWYVALRRHEERELSTAYTRPLDIDPAVRLVEDQITQNQMTHVVDVRPGWFRLATLWLVLHAIDILVRVYWVRGELGGITAIHFARWVIVPDKRRDRDPREPRRHRLVFFSNYDGSWESYLGEFIDRAATGLTAVWSNTVGFPATRHLIFAGASDEEQFKQWTREHQLPTQVWWSGVPDCTVQNIRDDLAIRRQLARGLADHEFEAWRRKL